MEIKDVHCILKKPSRVPSDFTVVYTAGKVDSHKAAFHQLTL